MKVRELDKSGRLFFMICSGIGAYFMFLFSISFILFNRC